MTERLTLPRTVTPPVEGLGEFLGSVVLSLPTGDIDTATHLDMIENIRNLTDYFAQQRNAFIHARCEPEAFADKRWFVYPTMLLEMYQHRASHAMCSAMATFQAQDQIGKALAIDTSGETISDAGKALCRMFQWIFRPDEFDQPPMALGFRAEVANSLYRLACNMSEHGHALSNTAWRQKSMDSLRNADKCFRLAAACLHTIQETGLSEHIPLPKGVGITHLRALIDARRGMCRYTEKVLDDLTRQDPPARRDDRAAHHLALSSAASAVNNYMYQAEPIFKATHTDKNDYAFRRAFKLFRSAAQYHDALRQLISVKLISDSELAELTKRGYADFPTLGTGTVSPYIGSEEAVCMTLVEALYRQTAAKNDLGRTYESDPTVFAVSENASPLERSYDNSEALGGFIDEAIPALSRALENHKRFTRCKHAGRKISVSEPDNIPFDAMDKRPYAEVAAQFVDLAWLPPAVLPKRAVTATAAPTPGHEAGYQAFILDLARGVKCIDALYNLAASMSANGVIPQHELFEKSKVTAVDRAKRVIMSQSRGAGAIQTANDIESCDVVAREINTGIDFYAALLTKHNVPLPPIMPDQSVLPSPPVNGTMEDRIRNPEAFAMNIMNTEPLV